MKYTISNDADQIARAQTMMGHKCPSGHVALAVATEDGASLPTGLVVRNKKTGVAWLAVGQVLRSIDPSIISPKRLGRPELPPEKSKSEKVLLRMTPAQREKLAALGGPEWVRQQIERAKVSA